MSKEAFIRAHEQLIEEYMDRYGVDWTRAYEATGDLAYNRARDNMAAQIDAIRDEIKERIR